MSHEIDRDRDRICRLGTEAWERLQQEQDWNSYMALGEAFLVGRQEAFDQSGSNNPNDPRYKRVFGPWLVKYGLEKFHPSDRAKLFIVMENRGLIEDWRKTLGLTQRLRLNHPTTVLRRWQSSTQVLKKGEPKTSKVTDLKQEVKELKRQHELDEERLAAADSGDLFDWKKTSAEKMAEIIVGNIGSWLSPGKVRKLGTELLRLLDDKPKAEPKKKATKEDDGS